MGAGVKEGPQGVWPVFTGLASTGGVAKVLRCAPMMTRAHACLRSARSGRSPFAAAEPLLRVRKAALIVSLFTSLSKLRRWAPVKPVFGTHPCFSHCCLYFACRFNHFFSPSGPPPASALPIRYTSNFCFWNTLSILPII